MDAKITVRKALENGLVVPAFNIPYPPMLKAVAEAVRDENSVAMIQVARLEWEKFESVSLENIAEEYGKYAVPGHTLLHLDHVPVIDEDHLEVDYISLIRRAIAAGYQSVMVDASRLRIGFQASGVFCVCGCFCAGSAYSSGTSGMPATLVSRLKMPARTDEDSTSFQFTSPMAADVPMVATAVWATVLMARMPAALNQAFQSLMCISFPALMRPWSV